MASKGEQTRERILEAAQSTTLEKGFAGMTIDDILEATALTKGAFFHHFKNKADLGRAVLERFAQNDLDLFNDFSDRADRLSDDPLERVLIFLRLFEEYLDDLGTPYPGCIFASYTHEAKQFSEDVQDYIEQSLDAWRGIYEAKFETLIEAHPPKIEVTARELAEMILTINEGGFILANAKDDATWTQRQSREFRRYLTLLFS